MACELALVSALPAIDQLVLQADIFFTRGTGLLSRLIRFFTRGIGESRRPRLIPHAVFLLTLLPPQASTLSAQSEKDVATLEEAEALCRAGRVKKADQGLPVVTVSRQLPRCCAVTVVPASVVSLIATVPRGLRASSGDGLFSRRGGRGANAMSAPTWNLERGMSIPPRS